MLPGMILPETDITLNEEINRFCAALRPGTLTPAKAHCLSSLTGKSPPQLSVNQPDN